MLEDCTMEKKPSSRSVQTPSKGCGTEVKKAQDTTSSNVGKQFPRQSRRREPPGSKWDQNRKSFPQKQSKTGYYDSKRPKPRGQLYYGSGKANTEVVDELTEELGLVATSPNGGTKKQSLNHLLNFHYAPRNEYMVSSSYHRFNDSGGRNGHQHYYNSSAKWLMSTQKHKYNKEQFLQANCQFVVRSDGDYSAYMGDPDILVDWDKIEQVRVISCEEVNCPICLSTPVAGKITRCGHVFCWSCMLHYLALSDKSWRKCPICYESVHRKDLRSVQILIRASPTIGEQITFRLMKREKGSLIASPLSQYDARSSHGLLSVDEDKLDLIYSKLLTANINQVSAIIKKEKAELDVAVTENEGCPELCFVEEALQLLEEREQTLTTRKEQASHQPCHYSSSGDNNNDKHLVDGNTAENQTTWVHNSDNNNTGQILLSDNSDEVSCLGGGIAEEDFSPTSPEYFEPHGFVFDELYVDNEEGNISTLTNPSINNSCALGAADGKIPFVDNVRERRRYVSASSTSEGEDSAAGPLQQLTAVTAEDLEISSTSNNANSSGHKYFYFYQAEDGQLLFLHAVNVRMLEMSYGSLENSPSLIMGTILEKESGSMTEELRKRLRYLQHLPVTCQFEVCEIDLKPPVITTDTLELFKEQLETRRRRREKRARDERRRERKMVEQVHRQYGQGPIPKLRIESLHHFPQCGSELATLPTSVAVTTSVETLASENASSGRISPSSSRTNSPVSIVSGSPTSSSTGLSFAQMLRDGKSSGGGWQTNPRQTQRMTTQPQIQYDSDNDGNPLAAPHYRQSFSEAITTALEQAALTHDKEEPQEKSNNGKKKKRKQKVLLFATGMACNSK